MDMNEPPRFSPAKYIDVSGLTFQCEYIVNPDSTSEDYWCLEPAVVGDEANGMVRYPDSSPFRDTVEFVPAYWCAKHDPRRTRWRTR